MLQANGASSRHISRDAIRFNVITDEDDYFAKEDLVFDLFCKEIQKAIDEGVEHIFVDATHITEKSRNKTLNTLRLDGIQLYAVNFELPLDVCLNQNENRKGDGRTYVPRSVIRRMRTQFVPAKAEGEKYKYHIITIKMEGDDE